MSEVLIGVCVFIAVMFLVYFFMVAIQPGSSKEACKTARDDKFPELDPGARGSLADLDSQRFLDLPAISVWPD